MLEIDIATKEDFENISKLRTLLVLHKHEVNPDNKYNSTKIETSNNLIKAYLEKEATSVFFLAKSDNNIVGFVHGTINVDPENGYLQDLYVIREFRKLKIGSALIAKLNEWYKEKNVKSYGLTTDNTKDNQGTVNFYKKLNYTVTKEDPKVIYFNTELN